MNSTALAIATITGVAAYFLLARQSEAATVNTPESPGESTAVSDFEALAMPVKTIPANPSTNADANRAAFLAMIRQAEGTANQPNPYAVVYNYAFTIVDFSDHPGNLGWPGVPLPPETCKNAGLTPPCVSTAAGAYQIRKATWNPIKTRLGLPDFSPASQDAAALELLADIKALAAIDADDFDTALRLASALWASLPYSTAQQGPITVAQASTLYTQAGGTIGA